MNERIQEIFKRAGGKTSVRNLASNPVQVVETHELWDDRIEKFAELIVKECAKRVDYWESRQGEHADDLLKHFGVEESKGWVCPKCGVDRTCSVCPLGHTASLTGQCPMTAEAQ